MQTFQGPSEVFDSSKKTTKVYMKDRAIQTTIEDEKDKEQEVGGQKTLVGETRMIA